MNEAQALAEHYRQVHARLHTPPNAVVDIGIDLKRFKPALHLHPDPPARPKYVEVVRFEPMPLNIRTILKFVAIEFSVELEEMKGPSRAKKVCIPRQIAIYLTHHCSNHSLASIARYVSLDHTTAIHSTLVVQNRMENSTLYKAYILSLRGRLFASYHRVPAN
jgi:hypothetical protein